MEEFPLPQKAKDGPENIVSAGALRKVSLNLSFF